MNTQKFTNFLKPYPPLTIAVIGDVMLDQYVRGSVKRLAPESLKSAPIPVLSNTTTKSSLGGAGGVAKILSSLGVTTHLYGVIGDDVSGTICKNLVDTDGIHDGLLLIETNRPTTQKIRFTKGHDLILRHDIESTDPIMAKAVNNIVDHLKTIESLSAIIISDYQKGVITSELMQLIVAFAKDKNIPIIVDPKSKDWTLYQGATLITPNKTELKSAGGTIVDQESIINSTRALLDTYSIQSALVTLSEDGMMYINQTDSYHQGTLAKHIINVSGAGDHVVAMMGIAISLNLSIDQSLLLASELTANHIEQGYSNMANNTSNAWDIARDQVAEWQRLGLKVGFTNGCFDILHAGHVMYLNQTKLYCDKLVLGLNSDSSVRLLKGDTRPINPEGDRSDVMMGLKAVDHVVLFGAETLGQDNTPSEVISHLKPDIYFKGGDYTIDQLPEAKAVLAYGGEVKILDVLEGRSTTNIITKSRV